MIMIWFKNVVNEKLYKRIHFSILEMIVKSIQMIVHNVRVVNIKNGIVLIMIKLKIIKNNNFGIKLRIHEKNMK